MFGLPFREIWALDFEFTSEPGAFPVPVCMVARELCSNRLVRLWRDELGSQPPFDVGAGHAVRLVLRAGRVELLPCAGMAAAAAGSRSVRGVPQRDQRHPATRGPRALSALSHHGLAVHHEGREEPGARSRATRRSVDGTERRRILDYCQSDVDCLGPLLERMLPAIRARRNGLGQALLRGRYTAAVARMEATGVPIDADLLGRIRSRWDDIKLDLVRAVDKDYGVYEGTTFKAGLFAAWLAAEKIDWPRTATGQLRLDRDTFRDMSKRYPKLEPLKELRHSLSELRLESLAVGPDGRNRAMLSPFGARSGRNTPSNTKFVFGPSVWIRGLIRPERGRALAYVDWSSQEVWIAAKLSGDRALLEAVTSGDPYLSFARMAGLARGRDQGNAQVIRDVCKTVVLGANYGMGAESLAYRTGLSKIEAQELLRKLAITFPTFTDWAEHVIDVGQLTG